MTNSLRKKPLHKYGRPVNPDRKIHNETPRHNRAKARMKARLVFLANIKREQKFRDYAYGYGMSIRMYNRLIEQGKHLIQHQLEPIND